MFLNEQKQKQRLVQFRILKKPGFESWLCAAEWILLNVSFFFYKMGMKIEAITWECCRILYDKIHLELLGYILLSDEITLPGSYIRGCSCQIYLTELNFAASISAHIEGCCRKQLSKLYSYIIYCCDGAQDVIFWIQKHFHYEDPREKFFSGQQNENLKQLACLYLVDNVGLFTEHISLLTLACRKCAAQSVAHL